MVYIPHNPRTGIQFKNYRFDAGNGAEALEIVAAFILTKRTEKPKRSRIRICKKHNYQFNFNSR